MQNNSKFGDIKKLFVTNAETPKTISLMNLGAAGFVIPEYQRPYDWAEENIHRLFSDIMTGFARLYETPESENATSDFAFLGSIILVKTDPHDNEFLGTSYSVIDGQQRLTTIALFACALSTALRKLKPVLTKDSVTDPELLKWITKEVNLGIRELDNCAIGKQKIDTDKCLPFPRIIRIGTLKGNDIRIADKFFSSIALFLHEFSICVIKYDKSDSSVGFDLPILEDIVEENSETKKLSKNLKIVEKCVESINETSWYSENDLAQFSMSSIRTARYRNLFSYLGNTVADRESTEDALNALQEITDIESLIRTLLFSRYFCKHIVLTLVTTESESSAFDIFDSLNTTGQPLTALETLLPRVVTYEKKEGKTREYAGSESDKAFSRIHENLVEKYPDTSKKQQVTKELIVSFRLYLEGKKLSKDLASQRNFLARSYVQAIDGNKRTPHGTMLPTHCFIDKLASLSKFRYLYFDNRGISSDQDSFHKSSNKEEIQLFTAFILSMKTTTSIPILFRNWNFSRRKLDEAHFLEALKAVSAFILLRRAATGTTANIDNDFRSLMATKNSSSSGVKGGNCIGLSFDRTASSLAELKSDLVTCLTNAMPSKFTKEDWTNLVIANPLYKQSRDLVKFMILIAAHEANPEDDGTWTKSDVRPSEGEDFFNYKALTGSLYKSVEHIAPDSKDNPDWDPSLYENENTRHMLGNLILLPTKENSSIGKKSWEKKRIFYRAATSKDNSEMDNYINEGKKNGVVLPDSTIELLRKRNKLNLLRPLRNLNSWDSSIVEKRSRNIAELCWDHIRLWLD